MAEVLSFGTLVEEGDIIAVTVECEHCHHRYEGVKVPKRMQVRQGLVCGECGMVIMWKEVMYEPTLYAYARTI